MRCPEPIATILIDILKVAMLRIRNWGHQGEARKCVYESDHVHNLPALLKDYRPELLAFYWNTERPVLIKQLSAEACASFQPMWTRLEAFVPQSSPLPSVTTDSASNESGDPVPLPSRDSV